jgi:5,5'-dehydrodivanillate O-demethylase
MLSTEENDLLCRIGAGTPMGNLMRRYWQPIAAVAELDETPTKQVRLMGEDLVLYRDRLGTYGLLDLHCPHRRADLSYGMVDEPGLRCNYHGWAYNEKGDCIDQPFEEMAHPEAHFKDKVKIKAYPVQAKAGLLWAYLGPEPVPELWDWDIYHETGYKTIVFSHIPCNWLQCAENDIDPVHFEWLHTTWSQDIRGARDPRKRAPTHLKVDFVDFEWGIEYRRLLDNSPEWQVGRVALWPNALYTGHFEWRVPVDDENTLSVCWNNDLLPGDEPFEQQRIPYFWSPIKDPLTGRWINSHTVNQDIIAWVGQGKMSDRWNEHLGTSDEGVIQLRKRFLMDIRVVEDGGDPKAILRDPGRNHAIPLPRTGGGEPLGGRDRTRSPEGKYVSTASRLYYGLPKEIEDDIARVFASRM